MFHNLYKHFYWGFFVDFKVSCWYVQTCITYSWNNAIAWTLNTVRKESHLSQEKAHHPTVISSTTLNPRYSMKENIQMWPTRTAYPTDPHCSCSICKCPRIQERQVLQGEVISFMREVNMKRLGEEGHELQNAQALPHIHWSETEPNRDTRATAKASKTSPHPACPSSQTGREVRRTSRSM